MEEEVELVGRKLTNRLQVDRMRSSRRSCGAPSLLADNDGYQKELQARFLQLRWQILLTLLQMESAVLFFLACFRQSL